MLLLPLCFVLISSGVPNVVVLSWKSRYPRPTPANLAEMSERLPSSRVMELLAGGKKIEAIKVYREETGVGLREAKDAVDRAEATVSGG